MKVTFSFNGKTKEVDSKDINSEDDVRRLFVETANQETKDVTEVLDNVGKAGAIFDEYRTKRDAEIEKKKTLAHEAMPYLHEFVQEYQKYVAFRKHNNIDTTTKYAELEHGTLLLLNGYEKTLAMRFNLLKRKGYDEFLLMAYPKLKPFCKVLVKIFKEMKNEGD